MSITDTQVLSYYYKGAAPLPESPILISSVTATEFLLIQSANPNSANYYPILPARLKHRIGGLFPGESAVPRMLFNSKKHAAQGKHRTDQLLLNFNGRMPSFIEFGSVAISQIINDGLKDIYSASISHLEKNLQKKLRDKLQFLISTNVQCLAVTPAIADVGMNILGQFLDKYEAKRNPRNTINDILILSTAVEHSLSLLTEDRLLKRFTAELLGAPFSEQPPNRLIIDFTPLEVVDRRRAFESKDYINRGWQVMERRGAR
jgi:predicted nucleic acid-binding protein